VRADSSVPASEAQKFVLMGSGSGEVGEAGGSGLGAINPHQATIMRDVPPGEWENMTPTARFDVLPAPDDHFVGRGGELYRVLQLLRNHRLVTVKGSPGIGKSSLGKALGAYLLQRSFFRDGIIWASMLGIPSPQG